MFRFSKQMFIGLLSVCIIRRFSESIVSNWKGSMKVVFIVQVKIDQQLLIQTLITFFFIHLLLVLTSVVIVVTLLLIHMLDFVFQVK